MNNTATALQARDNAFAAYEAARWGNLRSRLGQLHNEYIKACEAYNAARRNEVKF